VTQRLALPPLSYFTPPRMHTGDLRLTKVLATEKRTPQAHNGMCIHAMKLENEAEIMKPVKPPPKLKEEKGHHSAETIHLLGDQTSQNNTF